MKVILTGTSIPGFKKKQEHKKNPQMQHFPYNIIIQSFHENYIHKKYSKHNYFFHPVIKYLFRGRVCMGRVCMVRDLVAELVMGRVCYGPSLSRAEFVMGRDVPESQ